MVIWWVWAAIQVGLFLLAELIRPKPDIENAKPASLGDFRFPTATEDRPIPLLWGTCQQKGPNVVWYGDFIQEPIKVEIKTGLFSHETQVTGFRYHLGVQFVLCRGAGDAPDEEQCTLTRVWIGDVEVYSEAAIMAVSLANDGTGYKRREVLEVVGGTFERPAKVRVDRVNATGDITAITLIDKGEYSVFPSGGAAALSGGSGSGATVAMTKGVPVEHGEQFLIDCPDLFGGDDLGAGGVRGTLTFFAGTDDQDPSPYLGGNNSVVAAAVAAGGTGYSVGNILTAVGGTHTSAATVQVTAVSSGAVTSVVLIDRGFYSAFPASPASTTASPTGGTGCTLTLTGNGGFQTVNGVAPAYLRTCYVAPSEEPIYLGNSTQIKPWAFEVRRLPNPLGLSDADAAVNGKDANPANVLVEILTNKEWGLKRPISEVDTAAFSGHAVTLADEGNGFSMILDRRVEAAELQRILEEQIDGVVFFDQILGKWSLDLARGGYDVGTLPLLSASNIVELEGFARGAWADTTNQVSVKFSDRADQYKSTSALAQDQANIDVMQGEVIPAEPTYPGVKDRTLANSIAWRDLRGLSYPLAKGTIVVDRSVFDARPGKLYALTYSVGSVAFERMPVRVAELDLGELEDGRIKLSVTEDVFETAAGSFSDPGDTNWGPPSDDLVPFAYQVAIEAPRGLAARDPLGGGPDRDLLFAAARRAGPEVGFEIAERHDPATPTGAFEAAGEVFGLMLVGRLKNSLARGSAVPLTSLLLLAGPDSQAALEAAFSDSSDPVDLGTNLTNLVLVGAEFMLPSSAQASGADVQLNGVYRGALDSVQGEHPAGTPVYLVFAGAGLSDSLLPAGDNVEVKLIPFSRSSILPDDDAATISLTMSDRVRRPYPPSRLSLDGTPWAATTSMEASGSGPEDFAIDLSDVRRRDYRTVDEVQALGADAAAIFADFPAANSTEHRVLVRDLANVLLLETDPFSGTQQDVRRIEILLATDGVLPTSLRFDVTASHVHQSTPLDSLVPLRHDFAVTTALTGQFNFGARAASVASNSFTVTVAGVVNLTLSSAFSTGAVEYDVNGSGTWISAVAAGLTTGATAALSVSDTLRFRHTSADVAALKQLSVNSPGASQDGYMVLFT